MSQEFPQATINTQTIENRRAMLRRAIAKMPNNKHLIKALKLTLKAPFLRKAAGRGVFICYSRGDELFALDLFTDLREAGVRAWMDEVEVGLEQEMDWGKVVGNALRGCGVLLLVLSPEGLKNAEVQVEREYFLSKGKVVIPVLAQACSVEGLEINFAPIDFSGDYQLGLQQLLPLVSNEALA